MSGILERVQETWTMEKAKRARKAETPKRPSPHLRSSAPALYSTETGIYEDLMKAGIVDPTKVTRFALQNAASLAGLLMTTEAMVDEKPKKGKSSAPAMPPEDMY